MPAPPAVAREGGVKVKREASLITMCSSSAAIVAIGEERGLRRCNHARTPPPPPPPQKHTNPTQRRDERLALAAFFYLGCGMLAPWNACISAVSV